MKMGGTTIDISSPDIVLRQCQGPFYMAKRVESQRHDLKTEVSVLCSYTGAHIFIMRRKLK